MSKVAISLTLVAAALVLVTAIASIGQWAYPELDRRSNAPAPPDAHSLGDFTALAPSANEDTRRASTTGDLPDEEIAAAPSEECTSTAPILIVRLVDEGGEPIVEESRLRLLGPSGVNTDARVVPHGVGCFDVHEIAAGPWTVLGCAAGHGYAWKDFVVPADAGELEAIVLVLAEARVVEVIVRVPGDLPTTHEEVLGAIGRRRQGGLGVVAFTAPPVALSAREIAMEAANPTLLRNWSEVPLGRTESPGHFAWIELLHDERCWIALTFYAAELDGTWLSADADSITLALDPERVRASMGGLRGRVVDGEGRPLPSAEVSLLLSSSARERSTGEDGGFEFDELAPGPYRLHVRGTSMATSPVEVVVESGTTIDIGELVLAAGAAICGHVVDSQGERSSGFVSARRPEDPFAIAQVLWPCTERRGFEVCLSPGIYILSAFQGEGPARTCSRPVLVDTTGGRVEDVQLELEPAVEVVVEEQGPARSASTVQLVALPEGFVAATQRLLSSTESRLHVPPGTYQWIVVDDDGDTVSSGTLDAQGESVRLRPFGP